MLLTLIITVSALWLVVAGLALAICRMAASGDAAMEDDPPITVARGARQSPSIKARPRVCGGPGIRVWVTAPDARVRIRARGARVRAERSSAGS
ncbi:MAG TPA: hypothetical protein VGX16_04135 [Solirubrobacteraceae bacterium]|jgi:hypothetical protein|nr:hypothetical protein [Solirubrobacteraceae bacterium]